MEEIFQFLKPSQIAQVTGLSPVRFSQKLHGHKVRGIQQKFNEKELKRLKTNLEVLAQEIAKVASNL